MIRQLDETQFILSCKCTMEGLMVFPFVWSLVVYIENWFKKGGMSPSSREKVKRKKNFSTMFSLFITKTDIWTISLIFFLIGKLQLHTARFLLKYTSNWIDILKKTPSAAYQIDTSPSISDYRTILCVCKPMTINGIKFQNHEANPMS